MRTLSNAFIASRVRYQARLQLADGTDVAGDIKRLSVTADLNGASDRLTLGAAAAATLTCTISAPGTILRDTKVRLYMGRTVNGVLEEVPLGVFTITDAQDNEGDVELTGYDAMAVEMEFGYFPSGSPATAKAVLADLCAQAGVELLIPANVTDVPVSVSGGSTRREMIGYMAALLGCSACMDGEGRLALRWFTPSELTVDGDTIYSGGLSLTDSDWTLGKITCSVTTETEDEQGIAVPDTQTLTAGTGATGVSLSNPFMTQSALDGIFQRIGALTYRSGTVSLFGDLRHEVGDIVTVVDRSGGTYALPIMQLTLEYDGGIKMDLEAYAQSETEDGVSTDGPLTQAVKRYTAELGLFKTVMADNVTATNAKIGNLSAETAALQTAVIGKADIGDLIAANAAIKQLQAVDAELQNAVITKASVADLTATNANLKNVTADVANISSLLAGNVGAGTLQAIHITGDNVVIDDAIITDAMIASLSAGKLTAGTIYTSLIKIASDENENLLIDGSTIQIRDTNGTVRVQIGKDAAGDYSYYLWDAAGNLLWNPTGVTEAGLNPSIIKDIAIADDANISPVKIDMQAVAQRLNADGSLVVDASKVQIDNTTLAAAYKTVTTNVTKAQTTANSAVTAAGAAQTAADAAQSDIDNLSIGGRNLEERTNQGATGWTKTYRSGTQTIAAATWQNADAMMLAITTASISWAVIMHGSAGALKTKLEPDTWYTITIDSTFPGLKFSGYLSSSGAHGLFTSITQSSTETEYGYHYVTKCKTVAASNANWEYSDQKLYWGSVNTVGTFHFANLKVEKGNTATDWTPAPEDADAAIAAVTERTTTLETNLSVVQGQIFAKVWQTDITAVTNPLGTKVTTLEDNYATVNQTVQGIQTQIGSLSTTVGNNYTALDNKITTLSLTADGLQTQVTSVKSTANSAVTAAATAQAAADAAQADLNTAKANLAAVTSRVGATEDEIAAAQAAVATAQAAADKAQSDIDNLSIGGRNLLRYSRTLPTATSAGTDVYYITGTANSTTETVPDGAPIPNVEGNMTCFRAQMGSGNTAAGTGMIRQLVKLTVGETYTLSAWAYGLASVEHAGTVSATLRIQGGDTAVLYTNIPLPSFGRWYRVTKTFTVTADCLDENGYAQVRFGAVFDAGAYGAVRVGALKIEAGTMATDWTPAPEDADAAIAATQTLIQQTETSILQQVSATYATKGEVSTIAGKVELKLDTSRLVSQLNASADEINITGNRLVINSTNFNLAADGTLTAKGANISGTITTTSGNYKTTLSGGKLTMSYGDTQYGAFSSSVWVADNTKRGIAMHIESTASYMSFSRDSDEDGAYETAYIINYGLNPDGYAERHIFRGDARITGGICLNNTYGIRWKNSTGEDCSMAYMSSDDRFYLGNTAFPTYLRGTNIYRSTANGTMRLPEVQHGNVTITPSAANTPTGKAVTFPTAFSGIPDTVASPATSAVASACVASSSATGFTAYVTRSNTTATAVRWIAAY